MYIVTYIYHTRKKYSCLFKVFSWIFWALWRSFQYHIPFQAVMSLLLIVNVSNKKIHALARHESAQCGNCIFIWRQMHCASAVLQTQFLSIPTFVIKELSVLGFIKCSTISSHYTAITAKVHHAGIAEAKCIIWNRLVEDSSLSHTANVFFFRSKHHFDDQCIICYFSLP